MDLDLVIDVLLDTGKDALTLIPFLFVTYVAMEALEHSTEGKAERIIRRAGTAGPAVGAALGAIPQCGFSAMAGTLYAGRLITAGTLVAVILSTSDELIPVFLAHGASAGELAWIIGVKVVIGMVVGFAADAVLRALHRTGDGHPHIRELCERAHCHCGDVDEPDSPNDEDTLDTAHGTVTQALAGTEDELLTSAAASTAASTAHSHMHADAHVHGLRSQHGHTHAHAHSSAHGNAHGNMHSHAHGNSHRARWMHILRSALVHTVQVGVFIVVITFVCGLIIEGAGHDALASALNAQPVVAVCLSALIGLIPNCAASVAIAELYLEGTLAQGPMLAGLLVSGGLGLLVLFRTNYDMRQNVIIATFVYLVGVICGLVCTLFA